MKILVCIAYYGTENREYVTRLIEAYNSSAHDIDVVVASEAAKDLPIAESRRLEMRIGLPLADPFTLPYVHKHLFRERAEDYDLFIYTEDDTLILDRNIEAFLWATQLLDDDQIAGFLRTETTPEGIVRCSSVHTHFHWRPDSAVQFGDHVFAEFTNPHSACFILTRTQLRQCLDSGGFLTRPRPGRYDTRVTAATDPYTSCGLTKLICIDRLDDFLLPHLTNKYTDLLGAPIDHMRVETEQLRAIVNGFAPSDELIRTRAVASTSRWDKRYHEDASNDILGMVPASAKEVLSVGAGAGALEAALVGRGHTVTAIPLDAVIGAVAASRGVEVLTPSIGQALHDLAGRSFDAVVMSDILTRLTDPVDVLRGICDVATVGATIVATVPNLREEKVKQAAGRRPSTEIPSSMSEHGIAPANGIDVQRWLAAAGFVEPKIDYVGSMRTAPPALGSLAHPLIRVVAQRPKPLNARVEYKGEAPRVSIGLPVFNGERFLERSLSALTKQTWRDLEIIVSDDGSTDDTERICRNFAAVDSRVRYIRHEENRGAAFNYNYTFLQSRGEFFCWTAPEDIRHERNIAVCLAAFDSGPSSLVTVASSSVYVDEDGDVLRFDPVISEAHGNAPANRLRKVLDNPNCAHTIWGLMRASVLERTELFSASSNVLLAELALHGGIDVLDEQLFFLRHQGRMSRWANAPRLEMTQRFDTDENRPALSIPRRSAVEYLRAIDRAGLAPNDRRAARGMVLARMVTLGTMEYGGRSKRWVQSKVTV